MECSAAAAGSYQATYGQPLQISVTPSSLAFSTQNVGTSSTALSITLSNANASAIAISSIAITGTNSSDFSQTNTCGTSLAPASNCTISATFSPAAAGSRSAAVTISDSATGSPQNVTLTGTATAPATVSVTPAVLTFASQTVGTSSSAQSVTLSNTGGTAANLSSIAITGTNSGDFTQTTTCGASLAVGSTCTVTVVFKPTAAGTRSAATTITDSGTGSPHTVTLSGTAVAPVAIERNADCAHICQSDDWDQQLSQSVTLSNTGGVAVTITSIAVTGTNSGDFTQTNTCGASLAVGSTCTIGVTFKPTAAGARTAGLTITDSAPGSPRTITLSGTAVTAPAVSLSPSTLTFASQSVGSSSAAQTITLTNTGGSALTISSLALTGTNSGDFSQTNTCGTSVAAAAKCTIAVLFKPVAIGTRTAAVTITDNATGSPQSVALSGTAVAAPAAVSLSPTALTFASQAVGTSSTSQVVTLKNTGGTTLTVSSFAVTGTNNGDFTQTHTCGTSLAAGASCTLAVTFKPTAPGTRTAALSIADSASGSPQSVTLTGTGVGPLAALSPTSVSFPVTLLGSRSTGIAVTLSNTGNATLTISSIAITGTNSADFAQTNSCGTSLAAGARCAITVTFAPRAAGSRSATLNVSDNSTGSPQTATLGGSGTALSITPGSLSFGSQRSGTTSASQTISVRNLGSSFLTFSGITITGTNRSSFPGSTTCGTFLLSGGSCTVTVRFAPTQTGSQSASVNLTDSDPGSPQTVGLSGTGI